MSSVETNIEETTDLLSRLTVKEEDVLDMTAVPDDLTKIDENTLELLELWEEYENIAQNSYKENFIAGFLNLSRSNYNSLNRRFGEESFDLRPHQAAKQVEYTNKFVVIDKLSLNKSLKDKREKKVAKRSENEKTEEGTLRNRSSKLNISSEIEEIEEKEIYRDPINMFGGMVPYQLRVSQTSFNRGVEDIVRLVNLRNQMYEMSDKIEKLQEKATEDVSDEKKNVSDSKKSKQKKSKS